MIEFLALIFLAGLAASALCRKLKIPPVSVMLLTGIVLGPYVLNLLSPSILAVSTDLAATGTDYYSFKGGALPESPGLKESRPPCPPYVLCSCNL